MEMGDEIVVLHVDDEPAIRETVAILLEREDQQLTVDTAASAETALEILDDSAVDCIVSDYEMPGMDGIDFLEAVREMDPELPFVLYTGRGSEEIASEAIACGVTDYLQKGTGSSQYAVLANRVTNAVTTYHSQEHARIMQRIQRVLRAVNQRLVRAESRPEIDRGVCTVLSREAPYRLVWLGEREGETVQPRASAGGAEGYLDAVTVRTDSDEPTARALRDGELTAVESICEDGTGSWRVPARTHGIHGIAAAPLNYDDLCYGVVGVASERAEFLDERERDLLIEVAEDVAHAIHRAESERRLREQRADLRVYERAVESASDLIAAIDTDYTLVFANERYREFHGIDGCDVGAVSLPEVLGETWDAEMAARERRVFEGEILSYEVTRAAPDGEIRTFSVRDYPLRDEEGTILGVVGSMRDITGRKCREQ
ncbi:response regulator [Halorhabdus rudnickae]|uniref:response regulator n=1 Tax=Halorhabdus rudnickae TaxID=1775544 RepID=UPI001082B45E|nr:response regulator [Halorhabdus rudnickae]